MAMVCDGGRSPRFTLVLSGPAGAATRGDSGQTQEGTKFITCAGAGGRRHHGHAGLRGEAQGGREAGDGGELCSATASTGVSRGKEGQGRVNRAGLAGVNKSAGLGL